MGVADGEEGKIKISGEPVEKADIKIVRGYVVMPDQFDEVFENSSEIYKFFNSDIILGAVVSEYEKKAYIISVLPSTRDAIYTYLTVFEFDIE
jgi:hypothetical protein